MDIFLAGSSKRPSKTIRTVSSMTSITGLEEMSERKFIAMELAGEEQELPLQLSLHMNMQPGSPTNINCSAIHKECQEAPESINLCCNF